MTRAFSANVQLPRFVQTEAEVRPVLAAMLVAAIQEANETLIVPDTLHIVAKNQKEFQDYFLDAATKAYPTYGIL